MLVLILILILILLDLIYTPRSHNSIALSVFKSILETVYTYYNRLRACVLFCSVLDGDGFSPFVVIVAQIILLPFVLNNIIYWYCTVTDLTPRRSIPARTITAVVSIVKKWGAKKIKVCTCTVRYVHYQVHYKTCVNSCTILLFISSFRRRLPYNRSGIDSHESVRVLFYTVMLCYGRIISLRVHLPNIFLRWSVLFVQFTF